MTQIIESNFQLKCLICWIVLTNYIPNVWIKKKTTYTWIYHFTEHTYKCMYIAMAEFLYPFKSPLEGPVLILMKWKIHFLTYFFFSKTSLSQLSLKSRSCPLSVIINYMFRNNKVGVMSVNSLKKLLWCDQTFPLGSFPLEGEGLRLETSPHIWGNLSCCGVGFSHWDWHLALPADPAVQFFYLFKLQSQRSSWNTQFTSFWVF